MLSAVSSMSLEDYFLLFKVQNEIKKIRQVYLLYQLLRLAIVMAIIFFCFLFYCGNNLQNL